MEFFERAHVVKKKPDKSTETTKKQLKKMLLGFKKSDNRLIKDSLNTKVDFDDSTSVSGFSDLNLTNSSNDDTEHRGTVALDDEASVSDVSIFSLSDTADVDINTSADSKQNVNTKDPHTDESISEYNDDMNTLPELPSIEENVSPNESDDTISLTSESLASSVSVGSGATDEFDADGILAANIIQKLGIKDRKKNEEKKPKSLKKRKKVKEDEIDEVDSIVKIDSIKKKSKQKPKKEVQYLEDFLSVDDDSISNVGTKIKLDKTKITKKPKRIVEPKYLDDIPSLNEDSISSVSIQDSNSDIMDDSPPYVSIQAADMEEEDIADILGDYRHPTVRNLPSESLAISIDSSEMFPISHTDDASSLDVEYDEQSIINENETLQEQLEDQGIGEIISINEDVDMTLEDTQCDDVINQNTSYEEQDTTQNDSFSNSYPVDNKDSEPVNVVQVYYGKNNKCVLTLKHPAEIYIHGKVKVMPFAGITEAMGYKFKDKSHNIYAPYNSYAQCLRTVEEESACPGLFSKLTSVGISIPEAEEISTTINQYDAVICLQPFRSRRMDFVESYSGLELFTKADKNIDKTMKRVCLRLGCSLYLSRPYKSFVVNPSWEQAVEEGLKSNSRGIVCGGKGQGKSTFLRYYVNQLVARGPVLVIDLDPGQCELTVAGNVSATIVSQPMLGPNYTHLQTPEMMLNVAMINTMDNPRRYVAAMNELFAYCASRADLRALPWIVNTMGMCNNLGHKFLTLAILKTQPTFLFQIDSNSPKHKFEFSLHSQTVARVYKDEYSRDRLVRHVTSQELESLDYVLVMSQPVKPAGKGSLSPRDERYLSFLAYFGELLDMHGGVGLLGITPYEVSLQNLKIASNVHMDEAAVTKVINGKLIALCQHDSGKFTLGDKPALCHGIGLIRGIDCEKQVLYVVSPVGGARLQRAGALLYCDWAPELRGSERALPPATRLPYRATARYDTRALLQAPRRRFNPLQLLKMSRNS